MEIRERIQTQIMHEKALFWGGFACGIVFLAFLAGLIYLGVNFFSSWGFGNGTNALPPP